MSPFFIEVNIMSRRFINEDRERFNPKEMYRAPNTSGDTLQDPDRYDWDPELMTSSEGSVENGTSCIEPMNDTRVYGNQKKAR
mgnify:CR=1 FL=1